MKRCANGSVATVRYETAHCVIRW